MRAREDLKESRERQYFAAESHRLRRIFMRNDLTASQRHGGAVLR